MPVILYHNGCHLRLRALLSTIKYSIYIYLFLIIPTLCPPSSSPPSRPHPPLSAVIFLCGACGLALAKEGDFKMAPPLFSLFLNTALKTRAAIRQSFTLPLKSLDVLRTGGGEGTEGRASAYEGLSEVAGRVNLMFITYTLLWSSVCLLSCLCECVCKFISLLVHQRLAQQR